jgi:hypothetical protein
LEAEATCEHCRSQLTSAFTPIAFFLPSFRQQQLRFVRQQDIPESEAFRTFLAKAVAGCRTKNSSARIEMILFCPQSAM